MKFEDIQAKMRAELESARAELTKTYEAEIAEIDAAIRTFSTPLDGAGPVVAAAVVASAKRKRHMSKEARAAVSARMKTYWAKRRKSR